MAVETFKQEPKEKVKQVQFTMRTGEWLRKELSPKRFEQFREYLSCRESGKLTDVKDMQFEFLASYMLKDEGHGTNSKGHNYLDKGDIEAYRASGFANFTPGAKEKLVKMWGEEKFGRFVNYLAASVGERKENYEFAKMEENLSEKKDGSFSLGKDSLWQFAESMRKYRLASKKAPELKRKKEPKISPELAKFYKEWNKLPKLDDGGRPIVKKPREKRTASIYKLNVEFKDKDRYTYYIRVPPEVVDKGKTEIKKYIQEASRGKHELYHDMGKGLVALGASLSTKRGIKKMTYIKA
ncbi:hypothetical protein KAW38_01455 [Candidatus Micrarchaeota archaeon]|nr:hypothetical protein [Candidatus Micrarchaeota archaeon]